MRTWLRAAPLLCCLSCVSGTDPSDEVVPVPLLQRIEPDTVLAGGTGASVTLFGSGFVTSSEVRWNGTAKATELVNPSELRVSLSASDIAAPMHGAVSVFNQGPGGGTSADARLVVAVPIPELDSILPGEALALGGPTEIRVYGRHFTALAGASKVLIDDVPLVTQFISPGEVRAILPASLFSAGRNALLQVVNPGPGGGNSAALPFGVLNSTPVLTSVSPDSIDLGGSGNDVWLMGTGFVPGLIVWLDSVAYSPTVVGSSSVSVHIPSPKRGNGRIRVENPRPGGGLSNDFFIGIREKSPYIVRLVPSALEMGRGSQELNVVGADFAPDATVLWNGQALTTTYLPPDTLRVTVDASHVTTVSSATVQVINPRGGGPSDTVPTGVVPVARIVYANRFLDRIGSARLGGLDRKVLANAGVGWVDTWPTGERTLYTKHLGYLRNFGIFSWSPPGTEDVVTTDSTALSPSISSAGDWIYYQRAREIWRIRPDGTGAEGLVTGVPTGSVARWPAPSPAGDRLSYSLYQSSGAPADDLKILDLGTRTVTSLGVPAHAARWSPDGAWIAYADPYSHLRLIRPDGSGDRAAPGTIPLAPSGSFDWSPDSRYLLVLVGRTLSLVDVGTGLTIRFLAPDEATRYPMYGGEYENEWRLGWYPAPGNLP